MSGFLLGALWSALAPMIAVWLVISGIGAILFAWHVYNVQPAARRDEVGWTDRGRALVIGAPLIVLGLALVITGVNLP